MSLLQDLDLRKPGVRKPPKRPEFEVPTEEVLKSAELKVSLYGFVHSLYMMNKKLHYKKILHSS